MKNAPLHEILDQVTAYANVGAAEIQLTMQDVSAWGRDFGRTLPDLLFALGDLGGLLPLGGNDESCNGG